MRLWRNSYLAIIALVALGASILPAPAWSCPITGRVGDAAFVCAGMTRQCAHPGGKCCHPAQLPRSENTPGSALTQSTLAVLTPSPARVHRPVMTHAADVATHYQDTAGLTPQHLNFAPPDGIATARAAPSFYRCAQHGPPPSSGRSPPVV